MHRGCDKRQEGTVKYWSCFSRSEKTVGKGGGPCVEEGVLNTRLVFGRHLRLPIEKSIHLSPLRVSPTCILLLLQTVEFLPLQGLSPASAGTEMATFHLAMKLKRNHSIRLLHSTDGETEARKGR